MQGFRGRFVALFVGLGLLLGCSARAVNLVGPDPTPVCPDNAMFCVSDSTVNPEGYAGVTAWLNLITLTASETPSKARVRVYWLEIEAYDEKGTSLLRVRETYPNVTQIQGGIWTREPWFHAYVAGPRESEFSLGAKTLDVEVGQHPEFVYHTWMDRWPRVKLPAGTHHVIARAEVEVVNAAAQVGADCYKTTTSGPETLWQAGYSTWCGPDGRFILEMGK